jgi:molybdopterin-guanine dinucleotide biosynthesis protein A
MESRFKAVVLAGERPGGSAFSRELGLLASVLVEVAGKTAVARVIEALESSQMVNGGVLCGPAEDVFQSAPEFQQVLESSSFRWLAPESGPSASALAGLEQMGHFPALLTAADHALLTGALVDDFCRHAGEREADVVFGLVPYDIVKSAFPETRRTVLKFSDGEFCGSNLFAILNPAGKAGPAFWSRLEADRKRPWRMARHGGIRMLLKYALRRLSLQDALDTLSEAMGCRVSHVLIDNPRAAIDVDSIADRDLAVKILQSDSGDS